MDTIRKIYYNPETGFTGKRKLLQQAKKIDKSITMKDVDGFFSQNEVSQVHQAPQKKSEGIPIVGPINSIQMDLIFYPYPRKNNGYNAALTAVGINNRYGYAIPMKGKTASEAARAVKELIEQAKKAGHPIIVAESDQGSEFTNKLVQKVLKDNDIDHITGQEGDHNFMGKIERFNRTLKAMISK